VNTPGALPIITQSVITPRRSNQIAIRNSRLISQEAINQLLLDDLTQDVTPFIPTKLHTKPSAIVDYAHYAMPMIHPITGEHISSYKRLMNDPATRDTWMKAFGKDFGGMAQGNTMTGQTGTNAMFVMNPADVPNIPKDRTVMYARVVGELHQLPWRTHHTYDQHHDSKTPVEQRTQYARGKVYVP